MTNSDSVLVFQEFSRGHAERERAWISPSGRVAAHFDARGGSDPALADLAVDAISQLVSEMPASFSNLGEQLDAALGESARALNAIVLLSNGPSKVEVVAKGSVQLLEVQRGRAVDLIGRQAQGWRKTEVVLSPGQECCYIACSSAFELPTLAAAGEELLAASTRDVWNDLLVGAAARQDWSCVIFPVLSALSFRVPTWKYDPFVGPTEDLSHERRGLADVVSALFKDESFDGFRILPAPVRFHGNTDSLYDGLLVTPWGVFLLELKDWPGKVVVNEQLRYDGIDYYPRWPRDQVPLKRNNPVHKMVDDLKNLGSHPALSHLAARNQGWLTRIGALVFTHPTAEVRRAGGNSETDLKGLGAVVIARPQTLADSLKRRVRSIPGLNRSTPPLGPADIDRVVRSYMGEELREKGRSPGRAVGLFEITGGIVEKNDYAATYEGAQLATGKRVWIRELHAMSLIRSNKERSAALAMFRGNVALQLVLPPDPRLQRAFDGVEDGHLLYAVVEAIPEPTLEDWLATSPPREARLNLLRDLAEVLVILAENKVTHRALGASTVRVRGGRPVLTNFDLCHLESVATLSVEARNALDRAYLAPEADRPGAQITPSADIYSLGRLTCRVLTGELPFESYLKQGPWARNPESLPRLAERCGFESAEMLGRLHTPAAAQRPTARDFLEWARTW